MTCFDYTVAMKFKQIVVCVLLPGCCWMGREEGPPDQLYEVTYLPYKQPNRDPSYPKMAPLRDEGDGRSGTFS